MKQNIYYVIKKELQDIGGTEECTGLKSIYLYDIDTQSMSIIEIGSIENEYNTENSEELILEYLSSNMDINEEEVNLIEL